MNRLKKILLNVGYVKYFVEGRRFLNDPHYNRTRSLDEQERSKNPGKAVVLNYLLSLYDRETSYLEIGVRNPDHNFNRIKADKKYSVDPGYEFKQNPVDFPFTSDVFFEKLWNNEILSDNVKFDLIFIDGLHLAKQVDRDIVNSLKIIKEDGFIVLHDCNPPTEWHSRTEFNFRHSPALHSWNGTTWKAFLKWRMNPLLYSCCIDTDWGLGILSKKQPIGSHLEKKIEFYEFEDFQKNRNSYLNLISFEDFKKFKCFSNGG